MATIFFSRAVSAIFGLIFRSEGSAGAGFNAALRGDSSEENGRRRKKEKGSARSRETFLFGFI
jgi:hypothetical protein